jgi:uncharacterized membrane protein
LLCAPGASSTGDLQDLHPSRRQLGLRAPHVSLNKARFEAFSDGVFAFACTLLILGVVLPAFTSGVPGDAQLIDALLHLWPSAVAYALSFAVIGIMWQNHHALFRLVDRIDRRTVFLNLMLLAFTAFIPFATSAVGAYWWLHAPALLYGAVLTSTATAYNLLLEHLIRSRAFRAEIDATTIRRTRNAYRFGWVIYASATLLALVSPIASLGLYLLVTAFFLIPHGADSDLERG